MRKAKPKKRVILPDPVFNDQKVSKFVNHLMYDGKKNTSYEIFYNALDTVKAKMANEEKSALEIWRTVQVTHEGTSKAKQTKISMLTNKFHLFKMNTKIKMNN